MKHKVLITTVFFIYNVANLLPLQAQQRGMAAAEGIVDTGDYAVLAREAKEALKKGLQFIQSLSIEGGYVYHYTLDGQERWGEGKTDSRTIEVQPPGTPAVGMSFLRAYHVTNDRNFLMAAESAADALIKGQNDLGGWEHKIYFDRPKGSKVSFDDDQTQSAISFLMALDQEVDDADLTEAIVRSLEMMMASQLQNGGWPHQFPYQGNYHDFATFNDQGINDCIRVMIEADRFYGRQDIAASLARVGRFMMISQLPPPQPGWAQQYNEFLQPAWARSFEPPAVCPSASLHNINSLIDLYQHTGQRTYLEPIPDAIRWIKASQLPNGKWGRFLEIGTNKPLYYDRGRIRVDSLHHLSLERRTGYGYENDLSEFLARTESRYLAVMDANHPDPLQDPAEHLEALAQRASEVIDSQDKLGRWIVYDDKFRQEVPTSQWNGEYRTEDRISTALFNSNVHALCDFLEAFAIYMDQ
jgi:hypothetical protein